MSWTCIENREVRARKQHVCCLCGYRIRKGAKYIYRFGYDDGPVRMHMHVVCEDATSDWDIVDWECRGGCEAEFRELLGIE